MTKPLHILLVEDNEWDARVAREAFAGGPLPTEVHVVGDGVEAMQYLRMAGAYAAATRPDLVLLDLNLPKKDGREVLADMKADPDLRRIPVIVVTTSKADRDIAQSYDLHANAYINKPSDPDDYPAIVKAIEEFWFTWTTLPQ